MAQSTSGPRLTRVELTGSPRERGVTHGERFADEIEENVQTYLGAFEHYGASESVVYEQAEEFWPLIQRENEEYAEEMRGVAEGSGCPIEDITILNARYEVMYSAYAETARELDGDHPRPDGCTAFGAQPEITNNGHTIIGQNWDWKPPINVFMQDIRRDDKPNIVAMTEAGIVGGKIGVNEHGIGMLLNGLVEEHDGENPFRKPYHVRFREVLDAPRLDAAIEPLITKDRANSGNVLLGHAEGELIDLELAPETANYLYPQDGLLTHANHFEDRSNVTSEFEKITPDTLCRAPRLKRLLEQHKGEITIDTSKGALRDHFGKPKSICAHIDESAPKREQSRTNASFIIDLTERRIYGAYGPPCETEYEAFDVAS